MFEPEPVDQLIRQAGRAPQMRPGAKARIFAELLEVPNRQAAPRRWPWLVGGLLVGAFAMAWWTHQDEAPADPAAPAVPAVPAAILLSLAAVNTQPSDMNPCSVAAGAGADGPSLRFVRSSSRLGRSAGETSVHLPASSLHLIGSARGAGPKL